MLQNALAGNDRFDVQPFGLRWIIPAAYNPSLSCNACPMPTRQQLEQAAEKGLIRPEQIDPLLRFLDSPQDSPDADYCNGEPVVEGEEPLRFIRSFGDVFITVGIILLSLGMGMMNLQGAENLIPAAGFALMAEWLVRVRRLALPGIALLLAMLAFIADSFPAFDLSPVHQAGVIALISALFYARHRMPFSLLPLTLALIVGALLLADIPLQQLPRWSGLIGLLVFVVALAFDSRDPLRCSYLSDSAFWLHLVAAPLMVHGAMITLVLEELGGNHWIAELGRENLMIGFFIVFFLLALLLDRRAMLISTQLYVIYAVTRLLDGQWNSPQNILMYVVFALGLFVIIFGTYWYRVRRWIWGWIERYPIARWLPPFQEPGLTAPPR